MIKRLAQFHHGPLHTFSLVEASLTQSADVKIDPMMQSQRLMTHANMSHEPDSLITMKKSAKWGEKHNSDEFGSVTAKKCKSLEYLQL